MLLHCSRTVLAAIIWTILINNSAQEIISKETSVKKNEKNAISAYPIKLTHHTKDGGNMIDGGENGGSNGGKKSFEDRTNAETIAENVIGEYAVTNVVEKPHVRENAVSHEIASIPILTENVVKDNAWLETGDSKKNANDDARIFQHHPETFHNSASSERNIVLTRGTARDTNSLKTRVPNVSRAIITKKTKLKNDENLTRNGSLDKDIVETEGASKLSRRFEALDSTSLIIHSKASNVKRRMRKLSREIRSYEQDYSTGEVVPNTRRENDDGALMGSASLNDNSSGKDQQFGKVRESSNDERSNKSGNILSADRREKFSHPVELKIENGNNENSGNRMENMFVGNSRESLGENATNWKKEDFDNIPRTIQKKAVNDRESEPNEIVKNEAIDKTRPSIQRDDLSRSKLLNKIEAGNKKEMKDSVAKKQIFPERNEDSGVSSFSPLIPNSLEKKANRITAHSSIDYTSLPSIMANKIPAESTKELSGQIPKPRETPTWQEKISLSTRNIAKGYENFKQRNSLASTSYTKLFSEKRYLKNPHSSSLETLNTHNQREQKWKLQKINDPGEKRDEHKSYFASWLNNEANGVSTEKRRIIGEDRAKKNEISREGSSGDMRNNEKIVNATSFANDVNETSQSEGKFIDNPVSTERTSRIRINVVKTELDALKIVSEGQKKNLIGQRFAGVIDLRSDQDHRDWQGRAKLVEKIFTDARPANTDEILVQKDEASWRKVPLVNSETASSLWLVVKRENNVLDSIASVTTGDTRKMEFSESDGIRESRRIKNDAGGGDGSGVERVVFSKEIAKVVPRSVQFLQSTATKNNAPGDESVIAKNRENFIEKIYQTSRTDTLSSMDSPLAEVPPRDFYPNDDSHDVDEEDEEDDDHARNGNGKTSKVLDTSESELHKDKVFYQHREKDSQSEISLNIQGKSKVQSLPLAMPVSDASATTETDRSSIETVDFRPDNRKDERVEWKDSNADVSMVKNSDASSSFVQHITTLLNDRTDEITSVSSYEALVEATTKGHYDDDRTNDASEGNNIRTSKIDETDGAPTVNRLKLRDPNISGQKVSPEIQRDTRNRINDKMSNVKDCRDCEIVEMIESNVESKKPEKFVVSDSARRDNRVNIVNGMKKIEQSVIKVRDPLKNTIHDEITRKNENSVDSESVADDGHSLADTSVKLKTIDHTRPEKRIGERMQWKRMGILVRGQEPIIDAAEVRNLIVSGERVSALRRPSTNIEKLNDSIESAVMLDKMLHRRNGRVKSLTSSTLDNELYAGNFHTPSRATIEKKEKDMANFIETLAKQKRAGFSNNANDVPRDRENIRAHAASRTISTSDNPRRWKILVPDGTTMSSIKIDSSIVAIDRPSHSDGSPRRKYLAEHSQADTRPVGTSGNVLNPSNTRAKQIKRGFTSEDSISFSIMETTPNHSHVYGNIASTDTPEIRDVNLRETIANDSDTFELSETDSRVIEKIKSSKTDAILTNETSFVSIANPTKVTSSYITSVTMENLNLMNQFESSSSYSSLNQSNESSEIHEVIKKISSNSMSDPSSVDSLINDTENYNLAHENTYLNRDNNSTDEGSSRESVKIQLTDNKQEPRVMVDKVGGLYDTRTLNQTIKENSTRVIATLNQWPIKHNAVVEGDLVLGGLMMVHEREDSVTCGPVMPQGGVQALEAMLYTLDWLNSRDLVPGVKIGAHILDDCDKDTYGLEMAVDFIKGSISNIDGAEYHCNKTAVRKVISGVVGAASSVTSIQVANLLRLFRIPQVSFFSTSPELSNKMRFEYFTRTIPSDHYQVKAMVDIVLKMGWSYVSIIYEESNYGEKAYEELEKLLGKHYVCIAVKEKLSKDSGVAEAHVYDNIVLKLLKKPRARGCIIFASDQEVAGVMRAVRRCNATGAFSWIGSDGWSARSLVSDGNEPEMEGTLSVQPQANPVEGFEDYFLNLTVENNRRNPWFVEFWEDHFKCRYPNASQTPYNNYTDECTTTERLTKQNTAFEDQLQFVSDAVLAFAHAFRNMHSDLCHGKPGLCDAMKPTKGTELLGYLRRVKFEGLSGDVFHFDKNGDGPARYKIIHFKQISPGKYKWIRVGEYLEGELRLNMSEIQFRLGHPEAPESVCSLPCEVGQAKKYVEGESCCWHCFNCTQYQIRHVNDEKQCVLCPQGTVPDETHSYCRDIPEEFLRPESGWAIGAMSFSSTGILITLFVGGVFLKHNDTPIVRASGRELSYVLLTGILLCYLVTFALVLRPTDLVCSIQRFSAGFCFTVVYAALLTKTNRISRIFNAGKRSAKRPSFISPRSQLIICSMLVAIQILINAVWMVIDPAKARHHYPTREDNLLVCNSYIDASYMIAFTYPIILIVVCTVYAVLTRKIPEAFNESKHIGFTMYTTCVIWLAFVPLYFATGSHVALRITSMSVTISLSASVTIACLFTPKLYIILIHPERNVRPNMMHHRYNTTKGSVVTATNASSMMAPVTLTAVTCDQNKAVKKHVITTMDCSTQSEQFELEMKDRKNGKLPASVITRSTQTLLNNNGKDSSAVTSPVIKDISIDENIAPIKMLNIGKIGNGPLSQNEVPL